MNIQSQAAGIADMTTFWITNKCELVIYTYTLVQMNEKLLLWYSQALGQWSPHLVLAFCTSYHVRRWLRHLVKVSGLPLTLVTSPPTVSPQYHYMGEKFLSKMLDNSKISKFINLLICLVWRLFYQVNTRTNCVESSRLLNLRQYIILCQEITDQVNMGLLDQTQQGATSISMILKGWALNSVIPKDEYQLYLKTDLFMKLFLPL